MQAESERLLGRFFSETERNLGGVRWDRLGVLANDGWSRSHRPSAIKNAPLQFDLADDWRERDPDRLKIYAIHARGRRGCQFKNRHAREDVDPGLSEIVEIHVAAK